MIGAVNPAGRDDDDVEGLQVVSRPFHVIRHMAPEEKGNLVEVVINDRGRSTAACLRDGRVSVFLLNNRFSEPWPCHLA